MIPLALAFVSDLSTGPALDLDVLTLPQAGVFDGQLVRASVEVVNPPDTVGWWTVAGDDGGAITRSVRVPAWDEVRVTGVRRSGPE